MESRRSMRHIRNVSDPAPGSAELADDTDAPLLQQFDADTSAQATDAQILRNTIQDMEQQLRQLNAQVSRLSVSPAQDSTAPIQEKFKLDDFPKFTGYNDAQDIDDWIERLDAIYQYSNASEAQLLRKLPLLFKNSALDWMIMLKTQGTLPLTWTDWKDALKNAFRIPNYKEAQRLRLTRRSLQSTESMAAYFQDKLHLIYKCYGMDITFGTIKLELLMGIPTYMHALIQASTAQVTTIEAYRRQLLDLDVGLRSLRQSQTQTQTHSQPHYDSTRTSIQCYKCGKSGHYSNKCPQQQQQQRNPVISNALTVIPPFDMSDLPNDINDL